MAVYILSIERGTGIVPIGPYPGVVPPRVSLEVIGKEVAEPDAVRFGMLPCFCWPAIESMKDEDSR